MTSRSERARQRAAWRARREHELAEHLYMANLAVQELSSDGRWSPAKAGSISAAIDDAARAAGVSAAYERMLRP